MNNQVFEWQDSYRVGVDFMDKAHQQLFLVIFRFQSVIEEKNRKDRKAVCASMLRYLSQYTLNYLTKEEAYMRQIDYDGYELHKHLHDNLEERILPHLIELLEEEDYSDDSIKRFIAVLSSWLSSHILIEDKAITGSEISRWCREHYNANTITKIDHEFRLFAEDLFGFKVSLINRHYAGEYVGSNFYSFYHTFQGNEKKYETMFFCEANFVQHVVDKMTQHVCDEISPIALNAFEEFARSWSKAALNIVDEEESFEMVKYSIEPETGYLHFFENSYPSQSLIWKTDSKQTGIAIKDLN